MISRGQHEDHFCENTLILDQWFREFPSKVLCSKEKSLVSTETVCNNFVRQS